MLFVHLLVTLARLARPGGVRALAAESLTLKHQLLLMQRSRRRSPRLNALDRVLLGPTTLLVSPRRVDRMAVIIKSSTLLRFHRTLVKRKYRLLYGSRKHGRTGPTGPSRELIEVVLEMKTAQPELRLPEDCGAALQRLWSRA